MLPNTKKAAKHVTFQFPPGYELEESPLPSTPQLPSLFPATTAPSHISPPRAQQPLAETSHLPVAAIQRRAAVVPPMGQTASVPSTALPPLPPLVAKSNGAVIPPLPASFSHVALNPLLRPRGLVYNLLFESTVASGDHGSLAGWQREQPATKPDVRRMVIMPVWSRSRAPPAGFPGRLILVEPPVNKVAPVQIAHVLDAVHEWLHQPVDPDAWARSPNDERHIASTAFWLRVGRAGHQSEKDRVVAEGLLRIDYLGDRTYFGGLRPLENKPEIWQLDLVPANAR